MSNQKRLALINKNRGTFSRHLYSIFSAHFNARYSASLSGVDVVLPKLGSVPDSETLTFAFLSGEDDLATDRACQESLVRVLNMCRTYQHVIIGVFSPIGNIRNFEKVQAQLIEALGTSYFTTKMNLGWTSPDCLEEKDFLAQTPVFSMSILKCDINPDAKNRTFAYYYSSTLEICAWSLHLTVVCSNACVGQDMTRKHALAAFQHVSGDLKREKSILSRNSYSLTPLASALTRLRNVQFLIHAFT